MLVHPPRAKVEMSSSVANFFHVNPLKNHFFHCTLKEVDFKYSIVMIPIVHTILWPYLHHFDH